MDAKNVSRRIVYIAGYGRSGSTLLDTLLGNHPAVFGAGELTWLFQQFQENAVCSCGCRILTCPFWRDVVRWMGKNGVELDFATASDLTIRSEMLCRRSFDTRRYLKLWAAALDAILRTARRRIIVDSSKCSRLTFRRMSLLSQYRSVDMKVIHLVRNPRGVMSSVQSGSNRLLEKGVERSRTGGAIRGMFGWSLANAAVVYQRSRVRLPMLRVRYEDLVGAPAASLSRIGRFLDLDVRELVDKSEMPAILDPGHGIAGNRMRREKEIIFRRETLPDRVPDNRKRPVIRRTLQSMRGACD